MCKKEEKEKETKNETKFIPIKEIKYNGGIKCDMEKGPCACGAWH